MQSFHQSSVFRGCCIYWIFRNVSNFQSELNWIFENTVIFLQQKDFSVKLAHNFCRVDAFKKKYGSQRREAAARGGYVNTRSQSLESGLQTKILMAPYIKFEVTNSAYKPVSLEFKKFPQLYFNGRPGNNWKKFCLLRYKIIQYSKVTGRNCRQKFVSRR